MVGAGKSGLAAADFLAARGAVVEISDSRPPSELSGVPFPIHGQEAVAGDGFDLIIQSPGVPLEIPLFEKARRRGARIIGELELAAPELLGRIVAITGANGKTTTTALTGHIFAAAGWPTITAGNIGTAVTAVSGETRAETTLVLELSSFQLETISTFRAHISLVLNITPDHLDRHGSMDRYIDAKARLVETQAPGDFAILNAAELNTCALAARTPAKVVWFNVPRPAEGAIAAADGYVWLGLSKLMPISDIPLAGRHNVENVMAAAAAAWIAGVNSAVIARAVRTFPGVEHRIEFVREVDGVRYYNDSKATNVDAAEKAIQAFEGPLWIVLGGKDKNSDYRSLAALLATKAKGVLLIGAAAPIIRRHLTEAEPSLFIHDCGTLVEAIRTARAAATPGDVVLLSPACASFDQFENYEHRGRIFKQLVEAL